MSDINTYDSLMNKSHKINLYTLKNFWSLNIVKEEVLNALLYLHICLNSIKYFVCFDVIQIQTIQQSAVTDMVVSNNKLSGSMSLILLLGCLFVYLRYQWEKADLCSNPSYHRLHFCHSCSCLFFFLLALSPWLST